MVRRGPDRTAAPIRCAPSCVSSSSLEDAARSPGVTALLVKARRKSAFCGRFSDRSDKWGERDAYFRRPSVNCSPSLGRADRDRARQGRRRHRTVNRLEVGGVLHVSEKIRHGHVSRQVRNKIMDALAMYDVVLLPEGGSHGAGVRWMRGRANRLTSKSP